MNTINRTLWDNCEVEKLVFYAGISESLSVVYDVRKKNKSSEMTKFQNPV